MKTSVLKKLALAALVAGATAFAPIASAIDVQGDLEYDLSLVDSEDAIGSDPAGDYAKSDGRIRINVGHTERRGDNFVTALVQAEQSFTGTTNVADAWIQFGSSRWDLKVGRFEAFNLFPAGKDTFVSMMGSVADVAGETVTTSVAGYQANGLRGRHQSGLALTVNFTPALSGELGTVWGDRDGTRDNGVGDHATMLNGFRPVITWSQGIFSVSAGLEMIDNEPEMMGDHDGDDTTPLQKVTAIDSLSGFGFTASAQLAGGNLNVNYATADLERDLDAMGNPQYRAATQREGEGNGNDETTRTSFGMNYTRDILNGNLGVGFRMDEEEQTKINGNTCEDRAAMGSTPALSCALDDTVFYAAYSIPLLNTGATTTFAYSQSDAQSGFRVRFNYVF